MKYKQLKELDNILSLEYDDRYIEISSYFEEDHDFLRISKVQYSDTYLHHIILNANQLLQESADLSVSCWLLRAELKFLGMSAFFTGIERIKNLIDKHGVALHPISEEGHPSSSHASALAWLATPQCLNVLHNSPLYHNAEITLKDFLIMLSTNTKDHENHKKNSIYIDNLNKEFFDSKCTSLSSSLTNIISELEFIEEKVNINAIGYTLDLENIIFLFKNFSSYLNDFENKKSHIVTSKIITINNEVKDNSVSNKQFECNSREDAINQLSVIVQYYEIHEPSHPAPIFIKRIQKMAEMDFEKIIGELIPEAIVSLSKFTGK